MKPKKVKGPVKTTLGRAPKGEEPREGPQEPEDESILQRPMVTSVFGLRQVLTLLSTATEEVKDYVSNECDVLYECRVCRSLFRSLANFVLHKRRYCQRRYLPRRRSYDDRGPATGREMAPPSPDSPLDAVVRKLKEKRDIDRLIDEMMDADLSLEGRGAIGLVEVEVEGRGATGLVESEEIESNGHAVFQSGMKPEVMEICDILDNNEAIIGPDGKCRSASERPIRCKECGQVFGTRKTLAYHVKYKHNGSRLVYACPDCDETYAHARSVYRHMLKVHRKSMAQIRKLRSQICNNAIRRDEEPRRRGEAEPETPDNDKDDVENQWLADIETDSYFQMCGGCGKRFERKAALQSHTHTCLKRQQVCQNISNKKKTEENNNNNGRDERSKMSPKMAEKKRNKQGSAKRKPAESVRRRADEEEEEVAPPVDGNVNDGRDEEDGKSVGIDLTTFDCFEPSPDRLLRRSFPYIDTRSLTCLGCPSPSPPPYPTLCDLLRHMSRHFLWYRFQCRLCAYVGYDQSDCEEHASTAHAHSESSAVLPLPQWKSEAMARKRCGRIPGRADAQRGANGFCAENVESCADDDDDDDDEIVRDDEETSESNSEMVVNEDATSEVDIPAGLFEDESEVVAAEREVVGSSPPSTPLPEKDPTVDLDTAAIDLDPVDDPRTVDPPEWNFAEPCRCDSPAPWDLKRDDFVQGCCLDDSWERTPKATTPRGPDLIIKLSKTIDEEVKKSQPDRPKRTVKRSSKVSLEDFEYDLDALNKALRGAGVMRPKKGTKKAKVVTGTTSKND